MEKTPQLNQPMNELRDLPSVEQLLQTRTAAEMVAKYGRPLTIQAIRLIEEEIRQQHSPGDTVPHRQQLLDRVAERLAEWTAASLIPVINATGVILHTNLGRAPLSQAAVKMMQTAAFGYSNLEFDLNNGRRGSRRTHAEAMITRLTGAEAALVVNNNAGAVLLCLAALANRRRVVIGRSQLVEIGGGFRVPDVMRQSGAKLVEVGTTNRVRIEDFQDALQEPVALVLRAHPSNFKIIGFTEEPDLTELVRVAHKAGVPVLDDLGSGALLDTADYGMSHEPTVQESIKAGVDVVCFSGDKLLGGPQAGIIIGRADLLAKIARHPLARALRADKLCLAALTATLEHYLKDEAEREVPVWRMISRPLDEIKARAERWREVLGRGEVIAGVSTVGGGSLPGETQPTFVLSLDVKQPNQFLGWLRKASPPVIARVENDCVVLDPRTVLAEQEGALLVALQNGLKKT